MCVLAGKDKQSPIPLLLKNACSARGHQRRVDPPTGVWCPNPFPLCPPLSFAPLFSALGPTHPFFLVPPLSPLYAEMQMQKKGVCATVPTPDCA